MLRRVSVPLFVVALALWFGAEPLVHSHPLSTSGSGSPNVCAMCATGVDRPIDAPTVVAPLRVVDVVDDAPAIAVDAAPAIRLASRAPPAA